MLNRNSLGEMLEYKRVAWSDTEKAFIHRWIDSVDGMQSDSFGNRFIIIGPDNPTLMIACHTDTVHGSGGYQDVELSHDGYYRLRPTEASTKILKYDRKNRGCLGADDAAGMYVALRMIEAKVPALYVFHRAEEVGGLGSAHISSCEPGLIADITICLSIDRKSTKDIITHQWSGRTASDTFAESLGGLLSLGHVPSPDGSFTDSANYADMIAECSNISVGYYHEHSRDEILDVAYVDTLAERLIRADLSKLVVERLPGDYGVQLDYGFSDHEIEDLELQGYVFDPPSDKLATIPDDPLQALDDAIELWFPGLDAGNLDDLYTDIIETYDVDSMSPDEIETAVMEYLGTALGMEVNETYNRSKCN